MSQLRGILKKVFPEESLPVKGKTGVSENRRKFSIEPAWGEQAHRIDPKMLPNWPADKMKCDALFVCVPSDADQFVVLLVELKGSDVKHAMEQIVQSAEILCSNSLHRVMSHDEATREAFRRIGKGGHGGKVLGIILGRQGLAIDQKKRKTARSRGILLKSFTGELTGITCGDISGWMKALDG